MAPLWVSVPAPVAPACRVNVPEPTFEPATTRLPVVTTVTSLAPELDRVTAPEKVLLLERLIRCAPTETSVVPETERVPTCNRSPPAVTVRLPPTPAAPSIRAPELT